MKFKRLFSLLLLLPCSASCSSSISEEPKPTRILTPINKTADLSQSNFYVALNGSDVNPGTLEQPWATLAHAAEVVQAGQTVYVREGIYNLDRRIIVKNSGREDAWITFREYPGELAVLDAINIEIGRPEDYPHDKGTFQIEGVAHIRVIGLALKNSHQAGFMIRDSHHVEMYNNLTDTTFSPGIAAWETNPELDRTHHIKIIGNTVTHANTWDMLPTGYHQEGEPPHEAISIAGAKYFEVSYNHLYNSDKEGIDVKEVSKHGSVHHNFIDHMDRQGLYVDAWFGAIEDIDVYDNVVRNCRMSGMIISVENGKSVSDVRVHHNLFYNNLGTGFFFSRWGDGPRSNIKIYNNTIVGNGYGQPNPGEKYYWMTGGLYLFSNNLSDVDIRNNIIANNRAFQIGYSDHWLNVDSDIKKAFTEKKIVVDYNLILEPEQMEYPLYLGWPPDMYANVWPFLGSHPIQGDAGFENSAAENFYLLPNSIAVDAGDPSLVDPDGSRSDIGAFWLGVEDREWWLNDFPPTTWGN
jgi:hypothetical protein